ncbi:MAG TPA: hypothetical protein VKQ52_00460, partial [Puia sp.]|nr:hypothetical protein [Puia sp.]
GSFVTLAAQLLDLTATVADDHTVTLTWDVTGVTSLTAFHVQRSTDGIAFSDLGNVDVLTGQDRYTFVDRTAVTRVGFYRIQLDETGNAPLVSQVVAVRRSTDGSSQVSLRSAGAGQRVLYIVSDRATRTSLAVIDASGRVCWTGGATLTPGDNYIPLTLPALSKGVYYLSLGWEGGLRKTTSFLE